MRSTALLGVIQKSAWFMMHRIRLAMQTNSYVKVGGNGTEVEVDESFIGGKARNMHKEKRAKAITGTGGKGKAIVFGILERGGKVRTQVIDDRKGKTVQPLIREQVAAGSALYTDAMLGYPDSIQSLLIRPSIMLLNMFMAVHNGMENFWSLLKRVLNGTHVSVEPFHLFRYLDEQCFRYNNRATKDNPLNDADRFYLAMSQVIRKAADLQRGHRQT